MGLHALQRWDEHTAAAEIVGLLLGGDGSLDGTAGPEGVDHRTPGVLGVRTEVGSTVLADGKPWGFAGELEVDDAVWVDGRLDAVCVALLVKGDGQVIGAKAEHLLVEHEVREGI